MSAHQKLSLKSCIVSCIGVLVSHFALALVPRLFFSFYPSFISLFPISVVVLVVSSVSGRFLRGLFRVSASAPASTIFHILFIWSVYIALVRKGVPSIKDAVITLECALLLLGLYSILSGDPGVVRDDHKCSNGLHQSSARNPCNENAPLLERVRYCDICMEQVEGFDHHCPAFGNCIGKKNHCLFMVVLIGFITVEVSYALCSSQSLMETWYLLKIGLENNLATSFVFSTMVFSLLQIVWQVPFLMWHIYCICFNIKSDEWINWKKYPEFQSFDQPHPDQQFPEVTFRNPYDKGIIGNIKEFLLLKD